MTNSINPNPECPRDDCRFTKLDETKTCMYFQPIYDKNGMNINPDANTTSFKLNCPSCGKMWYCTTRLNETTCTEIK